MCWGLCKRKKNTLIYLVIRNLGGLRKTFGILSRANNGLKSQFHSKFRYPKVGGRGEGEQIIFFTSRRYTEGMSLMATSGMGFIFSRRRIQVRFYGLRAICPRHAVAIFK